ncbi:hypothetical protein PIB30_063967 [Stylosanthes scabra]|uniref:Uncharacterized protein n=1 Tax=Stylosanthes scabra TaxID=79078 RepID=A0ABU6YNF4_9FABA|nr:hypothetical protein [Stylosanthes scabra]
MRTWDLWDGIDLPTQPIGECGFVSDTAVNPWVGIFCRRQGFARESVDLPTRPIGRVWLRRLHAKHLYLGISGVYGDTSDISIHGLAPILSDYLYLFLFNHHSPTLTIATPDFLTTKIVPCVNSLGDDPSPILDSPTTILKTRFQRKRETRINLLAIPRAERSSKWRRYQGVKHARRFWLL